MGVPLLFLQNAFLCKNLDPHKFHYNLKLHFHKESIISHDILTIFKNISQIVKE